MSWQEELRRLDADLAAGRIEPTVHRKQRDELLAQASGATVPSPVPSPLRRPGGTWHSTNPAHTPPPWERPQPPARVEAPQPRTEMPPQQPVQAQYPRPIRQPGHPPEQHTVPEKTLSRPVVPDVPDHLTTAPSPADINPTRYLTVKGRTDQTSRFPPVGPYHPHPRQPEPEETGKHRWDDETAAPARERSRPTWLFLSLGVLVVLTMIVGATMWLGTGNDGSTPQAGSPAYTPSVPAGAIGTLEERLPPLPGAQNENNSTMSVDRGVELGIYPKATADVLKQAGATEVIFRGSAIDSGSNLLLVVPTSGTSNAEAAVEQMYRTALANGFSPLQADLRTAVATTPDQQVRATWYTSSGMIVNIGVSQPAGRNEQALATRLDDAVKTLRSVLPPG